MSTSGVVCSEWVNIVDDAKCDAYLRVAGSDINGDTVTFSMVVMQFR